MLDAYRDEDLIPLWQRIDDRPRATENALYAVIPAARAVALIVRYENAGADPELMRRAMEILDISVDRYANWGRTWASPSVVHVITLAAYRIHEHRELPPDLRGQAEELWGRVRFMAAEEADAGLITPLPMPMDSSETGDTKAEEFAWATTSFAAAILANPGDSRVPSWERKMRQLGYDSITRPSDPPDFEGLKFTTVTEDWALNNHDLVRNPFYTAATIYLLGTSVLTYKMQGQQPPPELLHNVNPLYETYKTYCGVHPDGQPYWLRPSDAGDPSLIPLAVIGDSLRDLELARARAARTTLTYPVPGGPVLEQNFYATVENHKIALYAVFGLYLWHYPVVSQQ